MRDKGLAGCPDVARVVLSDRQRVRGSGEKEVDGG